ncbi:hypothetical protein ACLB2K_046329 [Fragaria x ananassa]
MADLSVLVACMSRTCVLKNTGSSSEPVRIFRQVAGIWRPIPVKQQIRQGAKKVDIFQMVIWLELLFPVVPPSTLSVQAFNGAYRINYGKIADNIL